MKLSISFGAMVLALLLTEQPARSETLAEAIATAYRSNPTIEGGRYDLRGADEGVVQARAELRPTADLEVTGGYERTGQGRVTARASPFGDRTNSSDNSRAALTVVQPIYSGGRAAADEATADANVRVSREELRGTEGDLLLGVITAYVDVRRYERALIVWQTSVDVLERLEKEIVARQQAGELTRTDIAQADSQLAIARQQVVVTDQQLEAARSDYAALVGHSPGLLEEEPELPQRPRAVAQAYDLAEQMNPELARARSAEMASREQIVAEKAAGRPTIGLRGTATLSGGAVPYHFRDQDRDFIGSVVLTVPLSAGGRTASLVRQAEDRNSSDRLRIEATRRDLMRAIANAWNRIVSAGLASHLLDEQHEAAVTQLDGMIAEYRVGLRSTFDVLYAQQSLRDVEVALLASRRDSYVAGADLLRRTGLLEARAILTGVELHDPSRHLRQVEGRNAVPWQGAIAAIDRWAAPRPHQRVLEQPGVGSGKPALAHAASADPEAASLARVVPTKPIPGTVGRPVPTTRRRR